MSENTIKFIQYCGDDKLEMIISNRHTWTDLSDEYLKFLTGCGYSVTARDLADYFSEMAGD